MSLLRVRNLRRYAVAAVAALLMCAPAEAYYHYVYFSGRNAPFNPMRAQFNLAALPNNTLAVLVSDSGPAVYFPNDGFGSVLSEIKQAVAVWNGVGSSSLRLNFGGLEAQSQTENTPAIDVIFTDLPPGILGLGSPNLPVSPQIMNGPFGPFVPLTRSTVVLTNNTAILPPFGPGPSYLEGYFTTAVHELGHALGLQHTWTGSAMSQDVIRNTSRARPIDADDVAALTLLYGTPASMANLGSISGRVTFTGGSPAALASVVAISPNGPAISTLTNPDGSYTISGVPPGSYLVYAHPLPPDALTGDSLGLLPPQDLSGRGFTSTGPFTTQFAPGTLNPQSATPVPVTAGQTTTGPNFTVQSRAAVNMYNVVTFSALDPASHNYTYNGSISIGPAFVNNTQPQAVFFADMNGPNGLVPIPVPQSVTMLGVGQAYFVQGYGSPTQVEMAFQVSPSAGLGPRHLVFNLGNDIFVVPNGVNLVQKSPPLINFVNNNSDGTLTLTCENIAPDSRVYFAGIPVAGIVNGNTITVTPPSGISGQVAILTVFNSDGQNSMFLQSQNPFTYNYPLAGGSAFASAQTVISPQSIPAGSSSLVDITAPGANFVTGQVTIGFGSSDVVVNNVWVLTPSHAVANITVPPGASLGSSEISLISGFQILPQPSAFQIQPANPGGISLALPVVNASTGLAIFPGSYASVFTAFGNQFPTGVQLTLNGLAVVIQFSGPNQINFQVPFGFPAGPATLKASTPSSSVSVVVQIDNPAGQ